MEKRMKTALREAETILWKSVPEQFELLDADESNRILGHWAATVLLSLSLLSVYVWQFDVSVPLLVAVSAAAGCLLLQPLWEKRLIREERYFITSQRAILLDGKDRLYYMNLSEIGRCRVVTGQGGQKSLVLGACIQEDCERRLRHLASHPKGKPEVSVTQIHASELIFYLPERAEQAVELLRGSAQVSHSGPVRKRMA